MFFKKYINSFELYSSLGRRFKSNKSKIPINKYPVLLDLGVGENYKKGWVHVDFYSFKFKFWKKRPYRQRPEVEMDLRYPLKCPANTIDGIYSSHTIEHLNYCDAQHLLKEIYRSLKPLCWLRISVPDLEIYIDYYLGKNQKLRFETGCEAISYLTQSCGHKSTWDRHSLTKVLCDVGFINVKKVVYGEEGSDPRLIKETASRKCESLVIEAQKPKK